MSDAKTDPSAETAPAEPPKRSGLRRLVYCVLLAAALILGYLFVWPSRIDPVAFDPPPRPALDGPLAPNDLLQSAELVAVGQVHGPEDVEVDAQGRIITGTAEGRIVRIDPDGSLVELARTGGRPAGIATAPDGKLIIADAVQGLLALEATGEIKTLALSVGGEPLGFVDDVDVARDGTIYFSDASSKFGHDEFLLDMLEARPHGRLLRYDPATRETTELARDLYFANGVALSQNEDFVLVCETYRFRVMRHWLSGERAGTSEIFVDNLPGYPDNITSNRHGSFWLALFTVRNDDGDWLAPRPLVKRVMAKLPAFVWPQPQKYAFVIKLDENGQIVESLQDPTGKTLYAVTSAFERNGNLYLGSLLNDRIGKYKLP